MAYVKAGSGTIASMAASSVQDLGSVSAYGAKKVLILIWGGATGGTKVQTVYLNGAIDLAAYADNGDRLFSFALGAQVTPVGLTRTNAIMALWYPGRAGTGNVNAPGGWPFPAMHVRTATEATAGTATGVSYEIWVDDDSTTAGPPAFNL